MGPGGGQVGATWRRGPDGPVGWEPVLMKKLCPRRAFGEERRTVAIMAARRGALTDGTPGWLVVRASAFEEAMWY